jgi:hypothetical protein
MARLLKFEIERPAISDVEEKIVKMGALICGSVVLTSAYGARFESNDIDYSVTPKLLLEIKSELDTYKIKVAPVIKKKYEGLRRDTGGLDVERFHINGRQVDVLVHVNPEEMIMGGFDLSVVNCYIKWQNDKWMCCSNFSKSDHDAGWFNINVPRNSISLKTIARVAKYMERGYKFPQVEAWPELKKSLESKSYIKPPKTKVDQVMQDAVEALIKANLVDEVDDGTLEKYRPDLYVMRMESRKDK